MGTSIPATEHSVMTAWHTEKAAIENMIDHFGDGLFACVMDSYDYMRVSHAAHHLTESSQECLKKRQIKYCSCASS